MRIRKVIFAIKTYIHFDVNEDLERFDTRWGHKEID